MRCTALLAATCAVGFAGTAHGAVAVTDITTSPTASADVLARDDYTLTSATADGMPYSNFVLPSSATLPDTTPGSADFYFWANTNPDHIQGDTTGGNNPGGEQNAIGDALISTGVANADVTYQFAGNLPQYDRFFLFELGGNDAITITAIDSEGAALDLALSLTTGNWGAVATGGSVNADGDPVGGFQRSDYDAGESGARVDLSVAGLSFTPQEFTGTGNLGDATGFRVTSASTGLDPMLAVAVPVPEPAALSLLGLGGLGLLRRRRSA